MKKLLVVLLALAVVGTLVFAEDAKVSIGAWGRSIVNLYDQSNNAAGKEGNALVSPGPSWANGSRIGTTITGTSDKGGYTVQFFSNGGTLGTGDNAFVWAKPIEALKLTIGKIQGDTLRGKIGSDSVNIVYGGAGDEDAIFARFNPQMGLLAEVNVSGIYLGAAVDAGTAAGTLAETAYRNIQVGAGYTIENIGLARAQYIGASKKVQVAFAFTGMEGLTVDAGASFYTESGLGQNNVSVGANYGKDALGVVGRVDVYYGNSVDLAVKAWLDGNYKLADTLKGGVEATFSGMPNAKLVGATPYVEVACNAVSLRTGFSAGIGLDGQDMQYKIPVVLTYGF